MFISASLSVRLHHIRLCLFAEDTAVGHDILQYLLTPQLLSRCAGSGCKQCSPQLLRSEVRAGQVPLHYTPSQTRSGQHSERLSTASFSAVSSARAVWLRLSMARADLINWHLVWSSKDHYLRGFRGSPYKYFRIAGVATLNADENIFGASVQFSPRQANQPR